MKILLYITILIIIKYQLNQLNIKNHKLLKVLLIVMFLFIINMIKNNFNADKIVHRLKNGGVIKKIGLNMKRYVTIMNLLNERINSIKKIVID